VSFKPTSKKYNLTYANIPGLEICAKGTTLGKLQEFSGAEVSLSNQNREKARELMSFFASRIITWNVVHPEVEDAVIDGTPVCPACGLAEDAPLPTTLKGMECLEMSLVLSIMFGWVAAIASVSDPKEQNSNGGGTNIPEELMSMLGDLQSPLK
jgi:hypothetical protein